MSPQLDKASVRLTPENEIEPGGNDQMTANTGSNLKHDVKRESLKEMIFAD